MLGELSGAIIDMTCPRVWPARLRDGRRRPAFVLAAVLLLALGSIGWSAVG